MIFCQICQTDCSKGAECNSCSKIVCVTCLKGGAIHHRGSRIKINYCVECYTSSFEKYRVPHQSKCRRCRRIPTASDNDLCSECKNRNVKKKFTSRVEVTSESQESLKSETTVNHDPSPQKGYSFSIILADEDPGPRRIDDHRESNSNTPLSSEKESTPDLCLDCRQHSIFSHGLCVQCFMEQRSIEDALLTTKKCTMCSKAVDNDSTICKLCIIDEQFNYDPEEEEDSLSSQEDAEATSDDK